MKKFKLKTNEDLDTIPNPLNPHFSFQSPNKIFAKKNVCHYQKAEEKTQIIFNPGRVVKKIKIR